MNKFNYQKERDEIIWKAVTKIILIPVAIAIVIGFYKIIIQ